MELPTDAEIHARVKITKPDGRVIVMEIPQDDLVLLPEIVSEGS